MHVAQRFKQRDSGGLRLPHVQVQHAMAKCCGAFFNAVHQHAGQAMAARVRGKIRMGQRGAEGLRFVMARRTHQLR